MNRALAYDESYALNAICPYYTMFPLEYPLHILKRHQKEAPIVLDPFCGRGTTIFAARKLGLMSYGIDSSPIAAAIAQAKLASATVRAVLALGESFLKKSPKHVPQSPFFRKAYSPRTLEQICSLREGLLAKTRPSAASALLRAAALGCLHGPLNTGEDSTPSYFSNQMPRTFSTKPDYSVRFWKEKGLYAPQVKVIDVIEKKLLRIPDLNGESYGYVRNIKCSDARTRNAYRSIPTTAITVTSPPYYGMRTYVQDQWLRMWFLGGKPDVDYEAGDQLSHNGHAAFARDLAKVWKNVRKNSDDCAHLYVRFGTLPSAKSDARKLFKESLEEAGDWTLVSVRNAKSSHEGKRQADQMGRESEAADEYDFHAISN